MVMSHPASQGDTAVAEQDEAGMTVRKRQSLDLAMGLLGP